MKIRLLVPMTMLAALALPLAAQAQGTVRGAEEGAAVGGNAAGPIGAIVGGAVGAATGTVGGILGVDDRPRFREYVVRERRPSYTYQGEVRTASCCRRPVLSTMTYRLNTMRRPGYRYTVINGRPVLIEARSRRIVEVY